MVGTTDGYHTSTPQALQALSHRHGIVGPDSTEPFYFRLPENRTAPRANGKPSKQLAQVVGGRNLLVHSLSSSSRNDTPLSTQRTQNTRVFEGVRDDAPKPGPRPAAPIQQCVTEIARHPLSTLCMAGCAVMTGLTTNGAPWFASLGVALALMAVVGCVLIVQARTPQESEHRLALAKERLKYKTRMRTPST